MTHADKENNPEYLLRAVVVHHGKYFSSGTMMTTIIDVHVQHLTLHVMCIFSFDRMIINI